MNFLAISSSSRKIFNSLERKIKVSPEHWMYLPNMHSRMDLKLPRFAHQSTRYLQYVKQIYMEIKR